MDVEGSQDTSDEEVVDATPAEDVVEEESPGGAEGGVALDAFMDNMTDYDFDEVSRPNYFFAPRPKLAPTSDLKPPKKKDGVTIATMRRLQRGHIVREAFSKYPTEIEGGVDGAFAPPTPIDPEVVREPLRSFMIILRKYMGHDPASLTFFKLEDRIHRSTKASDESDSEHFQRIASTLQIVNTIKRSRVDTLRELVTLAQNEGNDDRQHERYSRAIAVKEARGKSEGERDAVVAEAARLDIMMKWRRYRALGELELEGDAAVARAKIALYSAFPDRPLVAYIPEVPAKTMFLKRLDFLKLHINPP